MLHDNNGTGGTNGHAHQDTASNVIRFAPRPEPPASKPPQMINLPPVTKLMLMAMIGVHVIVSVIGLIKPELAGQIYGYGGFTPASWSGGEPFEWWMPLTLLTFSFLHGGWLHLGINVLMLAAFGSGIEKWLGPKRLLQLFAFTSATALLAHIAFNLDSFNPVVGISGAISGYFGALLIMMQRQQALGNARNSMMPFIVIWIVTAIGFGMMGAPDGGDIAWIAHLGGFFGGLGLAWWWFKGRKF